MNAGKKQVRPYIHLGTTLLLFRETVVSKLLLKVIFLIYEESIPSLFSDGPSPSPYLALHPSFTIFPSSETTLLLGQAARAPHYPLPRSEVYRS